MDCYLFLMNLVAFLENAAIRIAKIYFGSADKSHFTFDMSRPRYLYKDGFLSLFGDNCL